MKQLHIVFRRNQTYFALDATSIISIVTHDTLQLIPGAPSEVLGLFKHGQKLYTTIDPASWGPVHEAPNEPNAIPENMLLLKPQGNLLFAIACNEVIGFDTPDGKEPISIDQRLLDLQSAAFNVGQGQAS